MRFSIITITYNAEKYIEETLSSVSSQSFFDYEHILWDGGSTDKTLEIARRFPHISIFQGKDSGISDAMNQGASLAKGDFLIHLHADDIFSHADTLKMIDEALNSSPEARWGYGRASIINEVGAFIRTNSLEIFSSKRLRRYNFITHPAVFISRELFFEMNGFNPHLLYCMDYDLWLRLSLHTSPLVLSAVLSCFRVHSQSLSTKEQLGVANEAYKVRNCYARSVWERWKSYRTWKKRINRIVGINHS